MEAAQQIQLHWAEPFAASFPAQDELQPGGRPRFGPQPRVVVAGLQPLVAVRTRHAILHQGGGCFIRRCCKEEEMKVIGDYCGGEMKIRWLFSFRFISKSHLLVFTKSASQGSVYDLEPGLHQAT